MRNAQRKMDREIKNIETQEKKQMAEIKKMAEAG
jgi:hypothetical protein